MKEMTASTADTEMDEDVETCCRCGCMPTQVDRFTHVGLYQRSYRLMLTVRSDYYHAAMALVPAVVIVCHPQQARGALWGTEWTEEAFVWPATTKPSSLKIKKGRSGREQGARRPADRRRHYYIFIVMEIGRKARGAGQCASSRLLERSPS